MIILKIEVVYYFYERLRLMTYTHFVLYYFLTVACHHRKMRHFRVKIYKEIKWSEVECVIDLTSETSFFIFSRVRSTSENIVKSSLTSEIRKKRLFNRLVLNIEFTSRVRQDFSYFH